MILGVAIPVIVGYTVINIDKKVEVLKSKLINKNVTLARVASEICLSDLQANDRDKTLHTLEKLGFLDDIEFISIVRPDKTVFATFTYNPILKKLNDFNLEEETRILSENKLVVLEPIYNKRDFLGSTIVISNTKDLNVAILAEIKSSALIMIGMIVLVIVLSFQIQKFISKPILRLASLAKKISDKKDYSLRVEKNTNDEIGTLVSGFNSMLNTIETTTVSKKFIDSVIASMLDPLVIIDKQGRVTETNYASCKMLGYDRNELIGMNIQDLVDDIHIISLRGQYKEANLLRSDGSIIPVNLSINIIDKNNMVCMAHDLTERKKFLNKVQSSLNEKEVMIKEIHHRVKNNLQIITSLLRLQSSFLNDPQALASFNEAQNRVLSMALIHEKLYQADDLAQINLKEYVNELLGSLIHTYSVRNIIDMRMDTNINYFGIDTLIPLGLLLNELISNSLKYAFPQTESGIIDIKLTRLNETDCVLDYKDNGIGMSREAFDENSKSLGMDLVKTLASQLEGDITFEPTNKGVYFKVLFKDQFTNNMNKVTDQAVAQ